jgi:hypothetical protein
VAGNCLLCIDRFSPSQWTISKDPADFCTKSSGLMLPR